MKRIHERWRENGIVLGCLTAAALYTGLSRLYYVGYFNDDALAILGAQSILKGTYHPFLVPNALPLRDPPPGFSLLLAPLAALAQPHWDALKWLSILATVLSLAAFWKLTENWLSKPLRRMSLLLFAFNPIVAIQSGIVLAEPVFVLFVLLAILTFRQSLERGRDIVLCGILAGFSVLIRPQGILLFPAIAVGLAAQKQWKTIVRFAAAGLPLPMIFWLRNALLPVSSESYSELWIPHLIRLGQHPFSILIQGWNVMRTLVVDSLVGFPGSSADLSMAVTAPLVLIVLGCVYFGIQRSTEPGRTSKAISYGILTFGVSFILLHVFWVAVTPRYFLPLLPFLILFATAAMETKKTGGPNRTAKAALGVIFVFYLIVDGLYLRRAFQALPPERTAPQATLQWVKEHTAARSRVLSNKHYLLHLHTSRFAYPIGPQRTFDEFRHWLLQENIEYVVLKPESLLNLRSMRKWMLVSEWLKSAPHAFPEVYSNPTEGTQIYQVVGDSDYLRAWEFYEQGAAAFDHGESEKGEKLIERALQAYPRFPLALNASAIISLHDKRHLDRAEYRLRQALAMEPGLIPARVNLSALENRKTP